MNQRPPVLTVSQITQAIKSQLESSFPQVWIQGEVSNFKAQSSGHLYFSLKDRDAQISCAMFRGSTGSLQRQPRDGDQVIVAGQVNVYPPRGNYQLIVRALQFSGMGELLLRLEQLKQELRQRGWFDADKKKALPPFPKRIGIVTSPTGAAIQDMLNILNRRFSGVHVLINPVRVQGVEAAGEIAQAIREFNHYQLADVLIVGRGGGSIEDLWPFNEEIVAQAIFESRIPVISAVGHETDYCIADLVADVRAPTPSAAAELVVSEKAHHIQALAGYTQRMDHALLQMLRQYTQRLKQLTQHPSLSSPYTLLGMRMQRLDEARSAIDRCMIHTLQRTRLRLQGLQRQASALSPQTQIQQSKTRLEQLEKHLNQIYFSLLLRQKEQLRRMKANLDAIAPQNLLQKGYSILFSENTGSVISTAQALASATRIRARLSDGELLATLKDIEVSCQTTAQK